jgi:drug/metabolite transporter (DMT)-like permease
MILLSILSAFLQATKDTLAKKLSLSINPYTLGLGISLGVFLVNLPLLFLNQPNFSEFNLNHKFFLAFIITAFMFAISNVFMNKAFQISDLSLVVPVVNFTPLFTLLLQFLIFRTFPNSTALLGILIIVFGSYFLKLDLNKLNFFAPIKSLFFDKGAQFMLIVSFVWALDNILSKIGTSQSDPVFWTIATRFATILILLPITIKMDSNWLKSLKKSWISILIMGSIVGISVTINNYLLAKFDPSVVTSLLRIATLFSVFYGILVFQEKKIALRIIGVVIMILGVVLITFS